MPHAVLDNLTIDMIGDCNCCQYSGLTAEEFLMMFPEHLPDVGKRTLLRVREGGTVTVGLLMRGCVSGH